MRVWIGLMVFAVASVASAGQSVDVAGTWRMDVSRSDKPLFDPPRSLRSSPVGAAPTIPPSPVAEILTVSFVGEELTLTAGPQEKAAAVLDGIERTIKGVRVKGVRETPHASIVSTRSVTLPGGGVTEVRTTERVTRADDGSLVRERTIDTGGVVRTWRFVYVRVTP
jgi:hypothetical protein